MMSGRLRERAVRTWISPTLSSYSLSFRASRTTSLTFVSLRVDGRSCANERSPRMIRDALDFDYSGLPEGLLGRTWVPSYCRVD